MLIIWYNLIHTANVDFKTAQGTVTFNPLDRESCTKLEIISDVTKEVPEDFHVSYSATIENVDDKIVVSPKVTKVTIIDSEIGELIINPHVHCDTSYI